MHNNSFQRTILKKKMHDRVIKTMMHRHNTLNIPSDVFVLVASKGCYRHKFITKLQLHFLFSTQSSNYQYFSFLYKRKKYTSGLSNKWTYARKFCQQKDSGVYNFLYGALTWSEPTKIGHILRECIFSKKSK